LGEPAPRRQIASRGHAAGRAYQEANVLGPRHRCCRREPRAFRREEAARNQGRDVSVAAPLRRAHRALAAGQLAQDDIGVPCAALLPLTRFGFGGRLQRRAQRHDLLPAPLDEPLEAMHPHRYLVHDPAQVDLCYI